MSAKYIFVTGGVVSSLGKGLAAASIGCLLESRGLKVNLMKVQVAGTPEPALAMPSGALPTALPSLADAPIEIGRAHV